MKQTLFLVYLDGYHLGDPVFLDELARSAASASRQLPQILFLHGSGEKAERTLEGAGHFIERNEGILSVDTEEQYRLIEQATREMNKEVVAKLTDQQLSAVGIQGVDKKFFSVSDGEVHTGSIGWLDDLLRMRVIPVVSGIAQVGGRVEEIPPAKALRALVERLESKTKHVQVVAFAKRLPETNGTEGASLPVSEIVEDTFSEPGVLQQLVKQDVDVFLTTAASFFAEPTELTRVSRST